MCFLELSDEIVKVYRYRSVDIKLSKWGCGGLPLSLPNLILNCPYFLMYSCGAYACSSELLWLEAEVPTE